jgi:hypothetical protein
MTYKSAIHDYLDPGETLAEVLFGLIMVLTITVGAGIISAPEELDTHDWSRRRSGATSRGG